MNAPWSGSPYERIVTFAWIWRNRIRLPHREVVRSSLALMFLRKRRWSPVP